MFLDVVDCASDLKSSMNDLAASSVARVDPLPSCDSEDRTRVQQLDHRAHEEES